MKRAIWYLVLGIVASVAAYHAGHWQFVSHLHDWDAFAAGIINILATTVGLGTALLLGSLLFHGPLRSNIALAGIGALCGLAINPAVSWLAYEVWKLAYVQPKFAQICREAHIDIRPMEARPTGLLFLVDGRGDVPAEFLLNQSDLQFIERQSSRKTQSESSALYERLEVQGERVRRFDEKSRSHTKFKVTPIPTPTAPVEARLSLRFIDDEKSITQRKVHLVRRSNGSVIASASIYFHRTLRKTCPDGATMNEIYAANLLLRGMSMPEVPLTWQ